MNAKQVERIAALENAATEQSTCHLDRLTAPQLERYRELVLKYEAAGKDAACYTTEELIELAKFSAAMSLKPEENGRRIKTDLKACAEEFDRFSRQRAEERQQP